MYVLKEFTLAIDKRGRRAGAEEVLGQVHKEEVLDAPGLVVDISLEVHA